MNFNREKFFNPDRKESESHFLDGISTPRINTNNPGTGLHIEAHDVTSRTIDESLAAQTRQEIINHYNIKESNTISVPITGDIKRAIRAFIVIEEKIDENSTGEKRKYYADGHTPHVDLIKELIKKFSELGNLEKGINVPSDFLHKWETKKGFIDPNANGFKSFPEIRFAFERLILEKNKDKLSNQEREELENNTMDLPDWFIVGK